MPMQKLNTSTTAKVAQTLHQHQLAVALKFLAIAAVTIALYSQDLSIVFRGALNDEATFHILAIPFLFAYLLFRRRKMVSATFQQEQTSKNILQKYFSTITGTLLFATAILTYWYGSYTFTPLEYHMVTLPIIVAGLTLILFGTQTLKQLIFPIAFLFFLTPPPSEFLYSVGSALSNISASASNGLVTLFGMNSNLSDTYGSPLITLNSPTHGAMSFSIDVACSGIYSIIGFTIFALFIAYITRGKLRNKLSILIMGIPLIIALNIIRISTVLTLGYYYGDELALQVFHSIGATVLMFLGTLLLLGITEKAFKKPKPPQPCPACNPTPLNTADMLCTSCGKLIKFPKTKLNRADITKIAGIAIMVVMLLSIQVPVFALTQGPAQVMIETPSGPRINVTNALLPNITGYQLDYVYRDTAFEDLSGQEASIVYVYGSLDESKQTIWVGVEISESMSTLHRWETCLINYPLSQGQQAKVTQLDLRDIQIHENPPITARYFAFQYKNTNQTQTVLYWYETATFNVNGTSQTKHVKMSLINYPTSPANVIDAQNQQLPIAIAINSYWEPIKTWTPVALAISQNGLSLAAATTAAFIALIIYSLYLSRREKLTLLNLYRKLPNQDQQLIAAVANAQKTQTATPQGIAAEFQKLTQTTLLEAQVAQKLAQAENAGLIVKTLKNQNDNPTYTWKSQIPQKPFFGINFNLNFFSHRKAP